MATASATPYLARVFVAATAPSSHPAQKRNTVVNSFHRLKAHNIAANFGCCVSENQFFGKNVSSLEYPSRGRKIGGRGLNLTVKVGVPRVPVMMDKEDGADIEQGGGGGREEIRWVNLHNILYMNGVLFLTDEITKENGDTIIGLIIHLGVYYATRDVFLFLNCVVDGDARTAVAISDTIQVVPPDVKTIGNGVAAGLGSFALLSGDLRLGYPHIRVIMHRPKYKLWNWEKETMTHYMDRMDQCDRIDKIICKIFAEKTGLPYDVIEHDMTKKLSMSAKEAQDYGILDHITSEFNFDLDLENQVDNLDVDTSEAL